MNQKSLSRPDKPLILDSPGPFRPSDITMQRMYPLYQQSEGITPWLTNRIRAGNESGVFSQIQDKPYELQDADFQLSASPKIAL